MAKKTVLYECVSTQIPTCAVTRVLVERLSSWREDKRGQRAGVFEIWEEIGTNEVEGPSGP